MTQEIMKKLHEHDDRFDKMDQRFDKMDQRFDRMDQRFEKVESISQQALDLGHKNSILLEARDDKLDRVLEVVLHTQARLDARDDLEDKYQNHEHRISAIESTIKNKHL